MTTSTTANQPSDRSSRTPSRRDFEIFRQAQIRGLTHAEIALEHRLTRRRASQIVARVRRWLSIHPYQDPHIATELQRKRLAQHTERMQLQDIIDRARNELDFGKKELYTITEKAEGNKVSTFRQQPFNTQALKIYLRAVEGLGRLNARPELPLPPPSKGEFPWLDAAIDEIWEQWQDKISFKKKLTTEHFCDFVNELEAAILKAASHQQLLDAARGTPSQGVPGATPTPGMAAADDDASAVGNALCGVPSATESEPATPEGEPATREGEAPAEPTPLPLGERAQRPEAAKGRPTPSDTDPRGYRFST